MSIWHTIAATNCQFTQLTNQEKVWGMSLHTTRETYPQTNCLTIVRTIPQTTAAMVA
ncbi:MAG TPA: hypothetical protein VMH22_03630 [bacterium]|nr:hypothetical protein [bacterium]